MGNILEGKVLIANRGEIAIRIMHACKDLGLDYVVVYTDADKESEHVRQNVPSGPNKNAWRVTSYTEANDIFAVADHTECTAIHPGYGFLSEDFRFARRATIRDRALTFIGPNWKVIRDLGGKINVKRIANKLEIPTIPGTDALIYNEVEAEDIALGLLNDQRENGIDKPAILIKAASGSGGMGIEEVNEIDQFRRIYRRLQNYAKRQFGDDALLIEQCLKGCNHFEVQLICSRHNEQVHFHSRNCTIQSTCRQKRVAAAPGFNRFFCNYEFDDKRVLNQIIKYSLKLAEYVKYDNVGTWEWLVDRSGQAYLLEVNPRIQVSSELSARISQIDNERPNLIREQIRLALGERLGYKQRAVRFQGAAIELRITAEDTRRDFTPCVGTITEFSFPDHPWSVTYSHVPKDRPYSIPCDFDANLALAIIWSESMEEATEKAVQFINEIAISGKDTGGNPVITNLDYLRNKLAGLLVF